MTIKNGDMPAMPLAIDWDTNEYNRTVVNDYYEGLTKREIMAMNSPHDVPEWFQIKPDLSSIEEPELTDHQINMMIGYRNNDYSLSESDFEIGSNADSIMSKYESERNIESCKQRYFSWKTFYADALLKELEG